MTKRRTHQQHSYSHSRRSASRTLLLLLVAASCCLATTTSTASSASTTQNQQQQQPDEAQKSNLRRTLPATPKKTEKNTDTTTTTTTNAANNNNNIQTRVVGGDQVTDPTKYPYFLEWEDAKCGASLIWGDIALSAAHCDSKDHPFNMRVFLLGVDSETGLSRTVERAIAHPLYDEEKQDYDFVVLKLHTSALVDEESGDATGAALIALNRDPTIPAVDDVLTGVGYGKTDETADSASPTLQEVEINAISDTTCASQYQEFYPTVMFCAGVEGGGRDTCQGDSGGPIIHKATGTQVGAVSFGIGCAQANYAGVNARVSSVVDWIDAQICDLSDDPPASCSSNTNTNAREDGIPPRGPGQLTVHANYDRYPSESAWTFTYLGTESDRYDRREQLHFVPFHSDNIASSEETSVEFKNLPAGRYSLEMGDERGDGNCCIHGDGKYYVTDGTNSNSLVWNQQDTAADKEFDSYLAAIIDIDAATGKASFVQTNDDYENSWEATDGVNHPPTFDQDWPGALPVADRSAVVVNIKYDAFPGETSWVLEQMNSDGDGWDSLEESGTTTGIKYQVASTELSDLDPGWYRFAVMDSSGNGICCAHRRGWASLTAPIIIGDSKTLVWGNNGEFGTEVDVFLLFNEDGLVSQITYWDPALAERRLTNMDASNENDNMQLTPRPSGFMAYTDLPKDQLHNRM